MGLKKKGVFFTFMCFIMVLIIVVIFASQRNVTLKYKQPIELSRVQALNELYKNLDQAVIPDVLQIASIRGLLAATKKVKSGYFSLEQGTTFQNIIKTPSNQYPDMTNSTTTDWLQKISEWAKNVYHLDMTLDLDTIQIKQKEPWAVEVSAQGKILIMDIATASKWETTKTYTIRIPIEGLPDPLWAGKGVDVNITSVLHTVTVFGKLQTNITTDSIVWEKLPFVKTLTELDKDERLSVLNASIAQRAFYHPSRTLVAPNYLQRFSGGTQQDAVTGIFTFVDNDLQNKIGIPGAGYSYVDYKFVRKTSSKDVKYLLSISAVDGVWVETVQRQGNSITIRHEFHIMGRSNSYRFKTDRDDRDYFSLTMGHYSCNDDVNEVQSPIVFSEPDCYNKAVDIGPPKATVTES